MGKGFNFRDLDDDADDYNPQPTPVVDLPYYETLREYLEPYLPASNEETADKLLTSAEIINAIENHHGVPQGPVSKGSVTQWVLPEDFTRAMKKLGFRSVNTGGQLQWLMKKKS